MWVFDTYPLNHSFYPLFPTALGDALDADQMAYLQLSVKPDLLVLPSQLKHFSKVTSQKKKKEVEISHLTPFDSWWTTFFVSTLVIYAKVDQAGLLLDWPFILRMVSQHILEPE